MYSSGNTDCLMARNPGIRSWVTIGNIQTRQILYYAGQPDFDKMIIYIHTFLK